VDLKDVESAADGEGERGVVASGEPAHRSRKVAVEAVHASKESLTAGLVVGMVGHAHPDTTHVVEEAKSGVEVGNVAGMVASASTTAEKLRHTCKEKPP
jgi:hypothetical protein